MDTKGGIGSLACRLCGASYQMPIHHLHEPIDVFSEWLDDCEAAEKANGTSAAPAGGAVHEDEEDDDDLLGSGSGLRRRGTGDDEDEDRGKKKRGSSSAVARYDDDDGLGDEHSDSD